MRAGDRDANREPRYQVERMAALSYSSRDALYARDFEQFTEAEGGGPPNG